MSRSALTASLIDRRSRPSSRSSRLTIAAADYGRLTGLGAAIAERSPDIGEALLDEIERAEVVATLPGDVVGMGSEVTFREEESGRVQRVRVVYPGEANIGDGRISILTPIGTALIGLRKGQTATWRTQAGDLRTLLVVEVESPA